MSKKINKKELNKKFDEYVERPFVILDFVIFMALLLPMVFTFSENILMLFHIVDISIWVLIMIEVAFKFWVVPSKIYYIVHDWQDLVCALLPMLPNFKIIREFSRINLTHGLRIVRMGAFGERIEKKLKVIMGIHESKKA